MNDKLKDKTAYFNLDDYSASGDYKSQIRCKCEVCDSNFIITRQGLQKKVAKNNLVSCSGICTKVHKGQVKPNVTVKCAQCGNDVVKNYSATVGDKNNFCNQSCSAKYNNSGLIRHGEEPKSCLHCDSKLKSSLRKFCNKTCEISYKDKQYYLEIELSGNGNPRGNTTLPRVTKRYLIDTMGHQCSVCKHTEWMGKPIPLVLDHIDGNSSNNKLSNLRLVCGNCDMQLPTYKSKNMGNGRHNRRQRYSEGKSY